MKDLLHTIEFIRESKKDDSMVIPEDEFTLSGEIPEPKEGEIVEFGWYEKDGERIHEVQFRDPDAEYVQSEKFEVTQVERHYHAARERSDNGGMIKNRLEVSVDAYIKPVSKTDERQKRMRT